MLSGLRRWMGRFVLRATGRAADLRLDGEARLVLPPRIMGQWGTGGGRKSDDDQLQSILAARARRRTEQQVVRRLEGRRPKF